MESEVNSILSLSLSPLANVESEKENIMKAYILNIISRPR